MPQVIKDTETRSLLRWSADELERLEDDDVLAMTVCLADSDVTFSTISGGDRDGFVLNLGRRREADPLNAEPLPGNGTVFQSRSDVRRFGLANGYLAQYLSKR